MEKKSNAEKGASFLDELAEKRLLKFEEEVINEAQEWKSNISDDIDYIIPFDCVARDIQQWILETSIYPQPAIAFASSLAVVSTVIGRSISYENIKGTLMSISMAESGEGKDWPLKAAEKILTELKLDNMIHKKMASGAALMDALQESPSMLLQIDEMGNYLSSISGKGANQFSKEIIGIITECYTSGADSFTGKRTKDNIPEPIHEPNINVLGMSTERQVFDSLTTSDIADGSLARYMIIFGKKNLLPIRLPNDATRTPPPQLIAKLDALRVKHTKDIYLYSKQLKTSKEYAEEKWQLTLEMKQKANSLQGEKEAFKPFYNRSAVRVIQMCMSIDQCQSIEVLEWCKNIELSNLDVFIKKFMHLGADNENERYAKLLQAKIKEAGKKGIAAKELLQKTRQILTYVRRAMLDEMLESGVIYTEQKKASAASRKKSTFYYWRK